MPEELNADVTVVDSTSSNDSSSDSDSSSNTSSSSGSSSSGSRGFKTVDEILAEEKGEERAQEISEENKSSNEPVQLTDVQGEDGFRKTEEQLTKDLREGDTDKLSQAPDSGGTDRDTSQINTLQEDLATTTKQERQADVNLSPLQTQEGRQLTESEARQRISEGRTKNLEAGPSLRTSTSAKIDSRLNKAQNLREDRKQESFQRSIFGNNVETPKLVESRTQFGETVPLASQIRETRNTRKTLEQQLEEAKAAEQGTEFQVTRDGETFTRDREEQINTLESTLEDLPTFTEEGERFLSEKEELEELPTFSLTERSVSSEFAEEAIAGQSIVAAQTFADAFAEREQDQQGIQDEVRQFSENPLLFGASELAGETTSLLQKNNVIDEQPEPRQAFQESTPELSILQDRGAKGLDELTKEVTTESQREDITEAGRFVAFGSTDTVLEAGKRTGFFDEEQVQEVRDTQDEIIGQLPEFTIREVPEKAQEIPSLAGATAQAARDPARTGRQLETGAGKTAESAVNEPIQFGVGELAVDAGLDLATGSATGAVVVPEVQPRVKRNIQRGKNVAREISELRRSSGESDFFTEAAVAASQNRPEQSVLSTAVDTGSGTRPQPDTKSPFDPVTPDELSPLQIPESQTAPQTQSRVQPQTEVSPLVKGSAQTIPAEQAVSGPESLSLEQSLSKDRSQARTETSPLAESLAVPQSQAAAQTQAQERTLTQPQARPQPQTQPRVLFDPDQNIDSNQRESIFDAGADQSQARAPSIDSLISGETITEEEAEDETFTGLESRPLVVDEDDNNDNDLSAFGI